MNGEHNCVRTFCRVDGLMFPSVSASRNKTSSASFGMFVSNTGVKVSVYRTRGSRMASGNFTTKPMMLYDHQSKRRNNNAFSINTLINTNNPHFTSHPAKRLPYYYPPPNQVPTQPLSSRQAYCKIYQHSHLVRFHQLDNFAYLVSSYCHIPPSELFLKKQFRTASFIFTTYRTTTHIKKASRMGVRRFRKT